MINDENGDDTKPFPAGALPMRDMSRSLPIALLKGREAVMAGFRTMLHEFDLTDQQWRVLRALAETPELEVVELAKKCIILQPSVSRILKKLEDRNLVRRRISAQDRRRAHISITPRGKEIFQAVAPESEALYQVISDRFGARRMEDLLEMLAELCRVMDDERD